MNFARPLWIFAGFGLLVSCGGRKQQDLGQVMRREISNASVSKLLKKSLKRVSELKSDSASGVCVGKDTLAAALEDYRLYSLFDFKPIWTDKGKLNRAGDSLYGLIVACSNSGLIPRDYYAGELDSLLGTSGGGAAMPAGRHSPFRAVSEHEDFMSDAGSAARLELLLTDGLFKLAVHLNKGRLDPDSLRPVWKIKEVGVNLVSIVAHAIRKDNLSFVLDSLEPQSEQYRSLKGALRNYRAEFDKSDWDSLGPIEKDTAAFSRLLVRRLISSHFLDTAKVHLEQGKLVEEATVVVKDKVTWKDRNNVVLNALKKFQLEHGLNDDGRMGKYTYAALNVSKEQQIRALEMNLERWRWESDPGRRYLWVNIPSFQLKVIDADTVFTEAKVITGNPTHPSPVLKSSITYFIIYPYWSVPYKIASEEILPRIKWDTAYLRANHFDVLDWNNAVTDPATINWSKYNKTNLPYKFRQQDGEDNSLGVIKFMFANPFGVYLHDTNSKRLFGKEVRALSHGCIRMQNPWVLADFLIRDDKHLTTDSLFTYYEKEQRKTIALHKPLPILIRYFTCEVDDAGKLFFYTDIYGKDRMMIRDLY